MEASYLSCVGTTENKHTRDQHTFEHNSHKIERKKCIKCNRTLYKMTVVVLPFRGGIAIKRNNEKKHIF